MFAAKKKRFALGAAALLTTAALGLAGCSSSDPLSPSDDGESGGTTDTIIIGSQGYYSNEIIAEIYAQALENAGYEVSRDNFNIGQRDAYIPSLESGEITLFPEYTGNLLEYFEPDTDARTPEDVYAALLEALPEGLTVLEQSTATDQDTYTVTQAFADEYDLKTIGDLANVDVPLTIGAPPEFEDRPYGPAEAKKVYGVDIAFEPTGPTTLEDLLADTDTPKINIADIYTADPAFQTEEIVALEDPENMILSSNVVPLVSTDIADEIADVINAISAKLTPEGLVALNVQSTVDQLSPADIATQWLEDNDLL